MNWDDEEETLWQRHRWLLPAIITTVGGGVAFAFSQAKFDSSPAPVRAPERMVTISLPPLPKPPPPPPPPKPPEPKPQEDQPKEEMLEQEPVKEEPKPEPPKDSPPAALGTAIKGDGTPDGFGLAAGGGNGMIGGTGNGSGSRGGSAFGWYASQVQTSIAEAVRRNGKTKFASGQRTARIWVDSSGRITRATISGGGEADVNLALNNEVLSGLQLREAPPSNMPMPIVLRINAQRPN